MERLKLFKVEQEPGAITPDSVYLIKRRGGNGFDMKVSNSEGNALHPMNCCSDDGGGNPGGGTDKPYRVYTAILAQMGQGAPAPLQELQNDFGQSMEFGYQMDGAYYAYMPGAFTDRTFVLCNAMHVFEATPKTAFGWMVSPNEIEIKCGSNDSIIHLEIRVYE